MDHFGFGFRTKILDYDFLYMPILVLDSSNFEQAINTLQPSFADPDQDAGGKGTFAIPAFARVCNLTSGNLSGEP